ncbi:hypothetical protein ACFYRN_45190 [Streptomyces sp. NPDC005227]|uniref:hypothetical protein n=1 Tax=Streptomyces sp. NPDC005227 TaxID=3364707 RepID=UPI0036AB7DAF
MPDDLDPGPHLVYRTARDNHVRTHVLVDREALDDPRERAICRALLLHALALLEASEPSRLVTIGGAPR